MTAPSFTPARTRVAPSPTGHMHLGTARTALYDYLLARKTGGQFVLRIEDTDTKRTVPGADREIMDGLRWLGIPYDEGPDLGGPYGPYTQSERRQVYQEHAGRLVASGHAYPCFCTPEQLAEMRARQVREKGQFHYDRTCRALDPDLAARRIAAGEPHVVRFKMPLEGVTVASDHLRGDIATENQHLDDYVLLKSDGLPTYHLAAIVDDHLMGITHVLRGSEWLSTFPLHVNIVRAFDWEEPVWVHLSVFLKPSGKGKMSKREAAQASSDGYSIFVKDLQGLGYTPEGVLNWIALMGWGVPEDDLMSLEEMVERFDVDRLTPSPAAINFARLDHFNGAHIRRLADADLAGRLRPFLEAAGYPVDGETLLAIVPLLRERLVTLDDCLAFGGFFFEADVQPDPALLVPKGLEASQALGIARQAYAILEGLEAITPAAAEPPLRALVERLGVKPNQVFGILRVATTGQAVSPPLFESMQVIGKQAVLSRVRRAIELLEAMG